MNKRSSQEIADQAAVYVSTRLDTPPTLLEVAQYLSTNTRILKTAFKYYYNMTLAKYCRELRLNKAKELLSATDLHISDIAIATGYSDGPGLTEAFIREFGISPGRYKRAMKNTVPNS